MDPRARVVAIVLALVLAAGAGYAVSAATDGGGTQTSSSLGPAKQPSRDSAPLEPGSSAGAADEYELAPSIKAANVGD